MNLKEKVCSVIIENNKTIKHTDGYVNDFHENLLEGIEDEYFVKDLNNGAGNELEDKIDDKTKVITKAKFKALWSSSALVVNNFAPFVKNLAVFTCKGNNFTKAGFERKYPTGLHRATPPHIDFFAENEEILFAFESKYTETTSTTKVDILDKYLSIKYLNTAWKELIEKYNGKEYYLDVAQLIKHSIGLINYKNQTNKKVVLVYIYWQPLNYTAIEEFVKHENEIKLFKDDLNKQNDIEFIAISYPEFWKIYEKNDKFKNHIELMRQRYSFTI
jgi:hypothetical protein